MKNLIFYLALLSFAFSCTSDKKQYSENNNDASQLYYNGEILTMESEEPVYAEAIVEQNGKIVCVGD